MDSPEFNDHYDEVCEDLTAKCPSLTATSGPGTTSSADWRTSEGGAGLKTFSQRPGLPAEPARGHALLYPRIRPALHNMWRTTLNKHLQPPGRRTVYSDEIKGSSKT